MLEASVTSVQCSDTCTVYSRNPAAVFLDGSHTSPGAFKHPKTATLSGCKHHTHLLTHDSEIPSYIPSFITGCTFWRKGWGWNRPLIQRGTQGEKLPDGLMTVDDWFCYSYAPLQATEEGCLDTACDADGNLWPDPDQRQDAEAACIYLLTKSLPLDCCL